MAKIVLHDGTEHAGDTLGVRPATLFFVDTTGRKFSVKLSDVRQIVYHDDVHGPDGKQVGTATRGPLDGDIADLPI